MCIYVCTCVCMCKCRAYRPSYLKIPGGPKWPVPHDVVEPCAVILQQSGAKLVCCFAARRATYDPYRTQLDGPFRRAKSGPSQIRRPEGLFIIAYIYVGLLRICITVPCL